jgi:hypothetical protein
LKKLSFVTGFEPFVTPLASHHPKKQGIFEEKLPNVTPLSSNRHTKQRTPSHFCNKQQERHVDLLYQSLPPLEG